MSRIKFQYSTSDGGPSRAENPLINIGQSVEPPPGPHRDFLVACGWPFEGGAKGARRTTALSRAYIDLLDAGLFDALDLLVLSTGYDVEGSLLNWVPGKPNVTNSTVPVTMIGGALATDGVASYLSWGLAANATRYRTDDAEFAINLTVAPPGELSTTPIVGGSGSTLRFSRNSASPYILGQINCSLATAGAVAMTADKWRDGLWGLTRTGTAIGVLRDGEQIADRVAAGTTAIAPTAFVGRRAVDGDEQFGAQRFTSFALGRALDADERAALTRILIVHGDEMVALAS